MKLRKTYFLSLFSKLNKIMKKCVYLVEILSKSQMCFPVQGQCSTISIDLFDAQSVQGLNHRLLRFPGVADGLIFRVSSRGRLRQHGALCRWECRVLNIEELLNRNISNYCLSKLSKYFITSIQTSSIINYKNIHIWETIL